MTAEMQHPQAFKSRPAAWDGHPIVWGTWELRDAGHLCIDHPEGEPHACTSCGQLHAQVLICRGHGPEADQGLTLIRCTGCGADVAVEDFGPAWDLDAADYDPEGSWPQDLLDFLPPEPPEPDQPAALMVPVASAAPEAVCARCGRRGHEGFLPVASGQKVCAAHQLCAHRARRVGREHPAEGR